MPGMYCIICGYDLAHSGASRSCSECGTAFDPDKVSTYAESPRLIHRVMVRWPHFHRWVIEHHCSMNCLCCGRRLADGREPSRCEGCHTRYDPRDSTTVLRALSFIPPALLRFQHVAPVRGFLLPLILFLYGVYGLITQQTFLPAFSRTTIVGSAMILTGVTAILMSLAWVGGAMALHSRYFWERVEPCWKWAPLGEYLGIAMILLGWGGAVGLAFYRFVMS